MELLSEDDLNLKDSADMQSVKFVCWQEDDVWLGYIAEHPDYWTQGDTLEDLEEHLKDLHQDLTRGEVPGMA